MPADMGIKERRQREFSEREELLLDAALDLIRHNGLLNLQMSRLAEKAEYAVGTLYLHFASKEDMLLALLTRSIRDYVALATQAATWCAPSRDRMFAMGVADLVFVRHHPDYFRIAQYSLCEVSWRATSPGRRKAFVESNEPIMGIVSGVVEDARRAGDLPESGPSPQEMAIGVWALCNGFRTFAHAEGLFAEFAVPDPYRLMCRQLVALLDGFGWKPLSGHSDRASLDALIARVRSEVFKEEFNGAA